MILLEAAQMALTAIVVGIVLGVVYGWAGAQALLGSANQGLLIAPTLPVGLLAGLAVTAASWPAPPPSSRPPRDLDHPGRGARRALSRAPSRAPSRARSRAPSRRDTRKSPRHPRIHGCLGDLWVSRRRRSAQAVGAGDRGQSSRTAPFVAISF